MARRGGKRKKHWMAGAVKHPGALTAQAEHAGETPHEFAEQHEHDSGTTGRRARLALVFAAARAKRKAS